jgi:type IV pilus assembly protein PilP
MIKYARRGSHATGLAAALMVLMLAGCAKSKSELEQYIAEVQARPAGPVDPLPVMKTFETFLYAAHAYRDPFAPIASTDDRESAGQAIVTSGPKPNPDRRKEDLERFPLDTLDMVGTLSASENGLYGLVKDPEGVVHRVLANNYLGLNDGRILGIYEDRIELVELIPSGSGGWEEQETSIALEDN